MEALERGAAIVTGNQRAARALHALYREHRRNAGSYTGQAAAILPWEAWTASLWRRLLFEGADERLLLNGLQDQMVWRGVIEQDGTRDTLRTINSLTKIARSAWELLGSYGGRDQLRQMAVTGDTQAFARWAERFERRCHAEGLLSAAQLEQELRRAVKEKRLGVDGEIFLLGFEGMTPAQAGLVDALEAHGCRVHAWSLLETERETPPKLVTAANEQDELRAAARWARQMLERNPDMQIAIIVPELETEKAEIDRVFREVLAPELEEIGANADAPYEFSLGTPLSGAPMIAAAMDLLRWTIAPLGMARVSALLLSPYFGLHAAEELSTRAEFDAFELRRTKLLRPEISLRWISTQTASAGELLASLSRILTAIHQFADEKGFASDRKRGHAEWMEDVRQLLRTAEWPGSRAMDSVEFQTRRKWESALDSVATLDFAGVRVSFAEALRTLEWALRETTFAPQSQNAPVQVIGVLESAGSTFDAVWFLRGNDAWPKRSKPHPLLPWPLQRKFLMPGTDAARMQEEARRIAQRIALSAPEVCFSYAVESKDGPQHRSPVITQLGGLDTAKILSPAILTAAVVALEEVPDVDRLPLLPDRVIPGGASILKLQAACGFRAFAERRLWATELAAAEPGMDASERGMLVHDVLERFWKIVKAQDALREMAPEQQWNLLAQCIDEALGKHAQASADWDQAYLNAQRQRLLHLLPAWLKLELTRKPFTVKLREQDLDDVPIGPLRLKIRMDRVDLVEGGEMLIDYKTGRATPSDWLGDRPEEPQLPLYAVLTGTEHLQAIGLAKIRPGKEMKLEGYDTGVGNIVPKATTMKTASLEEQIFAWREVLVRLAEDFHAGKAEVDPKKYPETCKYCAQRIVCRLDVDALEGAYDEQDAEDNFG